jgi:hypothetical protein
MQNKTGVNRLIEELNFITPENALIKSIFQDTNNQNIGLKKFIFLDARYNKI